LQADRVEIVIDTDFLSSFLKIGKLELVRDFFNVESVSIPLAVFNEIGKTKLVDSVLNTGWIKIRTVHSSDFSCLNDSELDNLGAGEKECMAICKASSRYLMLTNDKKARLVAGKNGIAVLNISAFLLACKSSNFLDKNQIAGIVDDLKQKDYFVFSKDELEKIY